MAALERAHHVAADVRNDPPKSQAELETQTHRLRTGPRAEPPGQARALGWREERAEVLRPNWRSVGSEQAIPLSPHSASAPQVEPRAPAGPVARGAQEELAALTPLVEPGLDPG